MKITVFLYFLDDLPLAHLKQIVQMETPYENCGKTVSLTFIIHHVARSNSLDTVQCKEN